MTYDASVVLRRLFRADLLPLMALKSAAGWNQTEEDWLRLLRLEPEGCFGIEVDSELVASATAVCYGDELAWIGMVLTLPAFRGRGLARRLMDAALEYTGDRTVRLDASDMGRPLYESLDFVAECPIERWWREPGDAPPASRVMPLKFDAALDREVFGANRSALLGELESGESASADDGKSYAFGRPGSQAWYFGPCVAASIKGEADLLHWCVGRHAAEGVYLDLFPGNTYARDLAKSLGFRPVRRLTRMVRRPAEVEVPDRRYIAIAGFEWG